MRNTNAKDRRVLKRARELLVQMIGMMNATLDERKGAKYHEEAAAQLVAVQGLWQVMTKAMPEEHKQTIVDAVTKLRGEEPEQEEEVRDA